MIAQTTQGNSQATAAVNETQVAEQQASQGLSWEEIQRLQGISASDQKAQPKKSVQQGGLLSRFAVTLVQVIDWVTGPASTDQERGQATAMMANTRSKSDPLY